MGLFSKDIQSLKDLFKHGLQDIYYAENHIAKSLPDMIENAPSPELKKGLQQHLRETENQVKRLEQVFNILGEKPSGTKCPAIDGILKEGKDLMGEIEGRDLLNVGIIAAAQAVEHYEMTRYGALVAWAKELGHSEAAALLGRNLAEEKATNAKLTAMADRRFNPRAKKNSSTVRRAAASRRTPTRKKASRKPAATRKKA